MMKWLLHSMIRRFERQANYDASYWHDIVDEAPGAGAKLFALPVLSQHRGPSPDIWAGAGIASSLDGDCGPCAQLMVDAAVAAGVEPEFVRACLKRDFEAAGDAGLGFRFAEAVISGDPAGDDLGLEIEAKFGVKARIAAGYAAATCRSYPVLKRAVGHGAACTALKVQGRDTAVVRVAA